GAPSMACVSRGGAPTRRDAPTNWNPCRNLVRFCKLRSAFLQQSTPLKRTLTLMSQKSRVVPASAVLFVFVCTLTIATIASHAQNTVPTEGQTPTPTPSVSPSPSPSPTPTPVNWSEDPLLRRFVWRSIGPASMGGRIDDIAVVESNPYVMYVGFATGGLWKTLNNG